MGRLTCVEEYSALKWYAATYIDDDGIEYDVIFTSDCNKDLKIESTEFFSIELDW